MTSKRKAFVMINPLSSKRLKTQLQSSTKKTSPPPLAKMKMVKKSTICSTVANDTPSLSAQAIEVPSTKPKLMECDDPRVVEFNFRGVDICSPSMYVDVDEFDTDHTAIPDIELVQLSMLAGISEVPLTSSIDDVERLEKKIDELHILLDDLIKMFHFIMQHDDQQPIATNALKQFQMFDAAVHDSEWSVVEISSQLKKNKIKRLRTGRTLKKSAMLASPFTPLQDSNPHIGKERMNLAFGPFRAIDEEKHSVFADFMDDISEA
ncbi:hypothetical protein FNV43_RR00405 [Rhamnella rubrinervis]|uniref:Uncharacterized protein n=1 Tax=Rhamnella rubrinervis TaxID=2594499 RepID=A0A8K0HPH5_9ROSA|nr:hypothetical protein FNV43_RR00405 [Rhamnella rubrinervis]